MGAAAAGFGCLQWGKGNEGGGGGEGGRVSYFFWKQKSLVLWLDGEGWGRQDEKQFYSSEKVRPQYKNHCKADSFHVLSILVEQMFTQRSEGK